MLVAFGIIAHRTTDRGWWLLGDLAAGDHVYMSGDIAVSFAVGAVGIALINLSPLAAFTLADEAAMEGA